MKSMLHVQTLLRTILNRSMAKGRTRLVVLACLFFSAAPTVAETVDLVLRADGATEVFVGGYVEIALVSYADEEKSVSIVALDAIIGWDPSVLSLESKSDADASYPWQVSAFLQDPDGINTGINVPPIGIPANDGNALYTAFAQPSLPAIVGFDGLGITTYRFRAVAPSESTIVRLVPTLGSFGRTRVFGEGLQVDVTGDITTVVSIRILPASCGTCQLYGDISPYGETCRVDLDDIFCVLDGFDKTPVCPQADLYPCGGNGLIDLDDIFAVLDAFADDYACSHPCPP